MKVRWTIEVEGSNNEIIKEIRRMEEYKTWISHFGWKCRLVNYEIVSEEVADDSKSWRDKEPLI